MKIKFNGVPDTKRTGGCNCRKRVTQTGLTTIRSYILPSGITKVFRRGRIEEVSDRDGEYLLNYQYTDKTGEVRQVFEVVE